jgi:hypothetical protein
MILSGLTVMTHATLVAVSGTDRQHVAVPVKAEIVGPRFVINGTNCMLQ